MTEQKFIKAVSECYCLYKKEAKNYHTIFSAIRITKNTKVDLDEHYLYNHWSTGGISGGSCWNDGSEDKHYSRTGEPEPEFSDLDSLLEKICPNITFLQYKKLMSSVIENGDYTENEWYGNCTNYAYKAINLRKLFDSLKELGL